MCPHRLLSHESAKVDPMSLRSSWGSLAQATSRPAAMRHLFPVAGGAGKVAAAEARRASGSGSSPAEQQVCWPTLHAKHVLTSFGLGTQSYGAIVIISLMLPE